MSIVSVDVFVKVIDDKVRYMSRSDICQD